MLQQRSRAILGFSPAQWFLSALFAIYMFEYMVTLTFIDQRSAVITGPVWQLYLHYIDYALVALGFASFALLRRVTEQFTFRRVLLLLPSVAYGCTVLLLFILGDVTAFSISAMGAAYFLGLLGGMVYFCMAAALADNPKTGRVMALGASAAVLLQYLLQEYWHITAGIPGALVLGFCAAVYLTVRRPWEWLTEDCLPYEAPKPEKARAMTGTLARLCLNVLCLYAIGTTYDRQMMLLNVQSGYEDYNFYAWPRLFTIVGYLLVGGLSDIWGGKLLSVATLCAALAALMNPVLFGDPAYYGDSYKGYYCYDTIQEISRPDPYSQTGTREFPEKYERYFRAIIELAVENQIPIYIVSIPYAIASDTQRTVNTAEQITKEYSSEYVHFIDFNKRYDEMGLDFSTDFSGIQHLNDNGAIKFTRYFGKILKEELDLPDHRSDARYASWEENARIFYRLYQNNDVKNVTDLFEYVELLHSLGDGYQIILVQNTNISKESAMSIQTGAAVFPEGKELSDEEKQSLLEYREAVCNAQTPNTFMETLFPDKEQWTFGGAWYWTEDGMEAIGENSSKFEKYIAYDQKNNLMLRSTTTTGEDDTYYHCELAYNGETQTSNLGLTFFVYDTDLNRLVDCVTFHNASTAGTRK